MFKAITDTNKHVFYHAAFGIAHRASISSGGLAGDLQLDLESSWFTDLRFVAVVHSFS